MKTKFLKKTVIFSLIVGLLVGIGCNKAYQVSEKAYRQTRNDVFQNCHDLIAAHGEELIMLTDIFFEYSPMKERIIFSNEYHPEFIEEGIYLSWDAHEYGYHPPEEILRAYSAFREKNGFSPFFSFSQIRLLDNNTLGFGFETVYDKEEQRACSCYLVRGDMNVALELDSNYRRGITSYATRSAGFVHLDDNWAFLWFVNLSGI